MQSPCVEAHAVLEWETRWHLLPAHRSATKNDTVVNVNVIMLQGECMQEWLYEIMPYLPTSKYD